MTTAPEIGHGVPPSAFYLIGSKYGGEHDVLPDMLAKGVICTGFANHIDLSEIIGGDWAENRRWLQQKIPAATSTAKGTLAMFASLRPGDLVAVKAHSAPNGTKARLVICRYAVVCGEHKAQYQTDAELGHTLKVDFLDPIEPFELNLGYGRTLHKIRTAQRIAMIFGAYPPSMPEKAARNELEPTNPKATHTTLVPGRGAYLMQRVHNELQNWIYQQLERYFAQQPGQPPEYKREDNGADIRISWPDKLVLIEVKSSVSPLSCVREALGQLLHYDFKLRKRGQQLALIVAGPMPASQSDQDFIGHVASMLAVPFRYYAFNDIPLDSLAALPAIPLNS